ncbi:MAG: hypothetical protein OXE44_19040 [Nitrospinae bacterium]|nr:hypothetical protein [Nitrospinota bacterium]
MRPGTARKAEARWFRGGCLPSREVLTGTGACTGSADAGRAGREAMFPPGVVAVLEEDEACRDGDSQSPEPPAEHFNDNGEIV